MRMKKYSLLISQLLSFGLVGGVITILSLMIYWGCLRAGVHYEIANIVAFVITVALAYILNNVITFSDHRNKREWSVKGLLKTYASYSLTGLLMASGLLWVWTKVFEIDENIAPLMNLFFTIPVNFLLNKYWVFKRNQKAVNKNE